jgi:cell division protease FtsH
MAWRGAVVLHRTDANGKATQVASVTIAETTLQGRFKEPQDGKAFFITARVDPDAAAAFEKAGVEVAGAMDSNWLNTILSWILPVLIFFGLWMFLFRGIAERQGMAGLMNICKSKAKVYVERRTDVTFDDVAGVDGPRPS